MKQRSTRFAIICSIACLAAAIAALVFYLQPEKQNIKWVEYPEAITMSKTSNKPIFLYFYAKWNPSDKMISEALFSEKELKSKLNNEYICSRITISVSSDTNETRKKFDVMRAPTFIVLNNEGKIIKYLANFLGYDHFRSWFDDSTHLILDNMLSYPEALATARQSGKPILYTVVKSPFFVEYIKQIVANSRMLSYINQRFVSVYLSPATCQDSLVINSLNIKREEINYPCNFIIGTTENNVICSIQIQPDINFQLGSSVTSKYIEELIKSLDACPAAPQKEEGSN